MSGTKTKLAALALMVPCCAMSGDVLTVNVDKNAYYEDESKSFRDQLVFNCDGRCDATRNPKTFEEATAALRNALPKVVLDRSVEAFRKACGGAVCKVKSVDFWNEFYRHTESVPYEGVFKISGYLNLSYRSIAEFWRLGYSCANDAILCNSFASKFSTSPDMQAEIIMRAAITQAAGITPVLNDVVQGMGDMIEPPRRTAE